DIGYEVVLVAHGTCELDLQISSRLIDLHATVLAESGQKHDSLLKHAIPGVSVGVVQVFALAGRPLGEQHSAGIFSAKECAQGSFEGPTEKHRRSRVFLLPPIKISMPIAPRTGEVLADLGVAVCHQATCGLSRFTGESSSQ